MSFSAAVVGCGRSGCGFDDDPLRKMINTHAGAYKNNPKTRLVAFCDIDEGKLQKYGKKFSVTNLFTNIDDMLQAVKPDLVSICTLPQQHYDMVSKAAQFGVKGIFCEKPISTNIEDTKKMIEVCKKNNVVLMINHQRRFDPLMNEIKKTIENNILGYITHTTFYYTAGIYNTGTHVIDLLRFFFGDIEWISGEKSKVKSSDPDDPNLDGTIKFRNGTVASIKAFDVKDFLIFEQDIIGIKGRFRILESGMKIEYYKVSDSKYYTGYKELEKHELPFEFPQKREMWIEGVKHVTECVEGGIVPKSSGDDGLKALEAILALIESSENNSKKIYLID